MNCHNRMCGIWSHDQSGKELCCMTCEHVMNDHESKTYSGKVLSLLTRIADGLEKGANPMMAVKTMPTRYNPAHIYADICTALAGLEDTGEIKKEVKKILGLEE